MHKMSMAAVAVAIGLCAGTSANATSYRYSYDFGSVIASGTLEGTLRSDGNTIDLTDAGVPLLDGVSFDPSVHILSGIAASLGGTPFATLDGSSIDFAVVDSTGTGAAAAMNGVQFYVGSAGSAAAYLVAGTLNPQTFDAAKWSISAAAPRVPLPATGWLLVGALGGLSAARRRRSAR